MGLYKPVGGSTGPGCSLLRFDFQEKIYPIKHPISHLGQALYLWLCLCLRKPNTEFSSRYTSSTRVADVIRTSPGPGIESRSWEFFFIFHRSLFFRELEAIKRSFLVGCDVDLSFNSNLKREEL